MKEELPAIGGEHALPDGRFGVIDIGSNSVRFVVFDSAMRSPAYFFNEKVYCGLGDEIETTGKLSPDGKTRALSTLQRFAELSKALHLKKLKTIATAAMRDALDGDSFAKKIERETGLSVNIITGEQEGRFAALGVLLGDRRSEGLVVDIGGASMELSTLRKGKVLNSATTPLGPLRLAATGKSGDDLREYARKTIAKNLPGKDPDKDRVKDVYLVGGGWRAFATVAMQRMAYPLGVLHGFEMTIEQVRETAGWMLTTEDDLTQYGISKSRAKNAPLTAHVILALLDVITPQSIRISSCGLREGVLYSNLKPDMRSADPLTQSAEIMERMYARFPGFGVELAKWIAPTLPKMPERLGLAAALLSDVNWRVHPDYRANACFTTATQSSFLGMTHPERMMLAVALAHRYKGAKAAISRTKSVDILSADELRRAEAMGRIIRLGAMLSGATPALLNQCPLRRSETALTLTIPHDLRSLLTGTVERRLNSAAQCLGLESIVATGCE